MDLMPQDQLDLYLDFLREVLLILRNVEMPREQVFDLADAVHNLPVDIRHSEKFDEKQFRDGLAQYDARWRSDMVGLLNRCRGR